jgi:hypothetical protein
MSQISRMCSLLKNVLDTVLGTSNVLLNYWTDHIQVRVSIIILILHLGKSGSRKVNWLDPQITPQLASKRAGIQI